MKWKAHGERVIYDSAWVRLSTVDVDVPGHGRIDHHVVRIPSQVAGAVVRDPDRGVLLLWRHRFITDTWGWEVPAGRIDPGETAEAGAEREALEETGWRPFGLRHLLTYQPLSGLSDQRFHVFTAEGAEHVGPPSDPSESERVEWVPLGRVRDLVLGGEVREGLSLTALLYCLAGGFFS